MLRERVAEHPVWRTESGEIEPRSVADLFDDHGGTVAQPDPACPMPGGVLLFGRSPARVQTYDGKTLRAPCTDDPVSGALHAESLAPLAQPETRCAAWGGVHYHRHPVQGDEYR